MRIYLTIPCLFWAVSALVVPEPKHAALDVLHRRSSDLTSTNTPQSKAQIEIGRMIETLNDTLANLVELAHSEASSPTASAVQTGHSTVKDSVAVLSAPTAAAYSFLQQTNPVSGASMITNIQGSAIEFTLASAAIVTGYHSGGPSVVPETYRFLLPFPSTATAAPTKDASTTTDTMDTTSTVYNSDLPEIVPSAAGASALMTVAQGSTVPTFTYPTVLISATAPRENTPAPTDTSSTNQVLASVNELPLAATQAGPTAISEASFSSTGDWTTFVTEMITSQPTQYWSTSYRNFDPTADESTVQATTTITQTVYPPETENTASATSTATQHLPKLYNADSINGTKILEVLQDDASKLKSRFLHLGQPTKTKPPFAAFPTKFAWPTPLADF